MGKAWAVRILVIAVAAMVTVAAWRAGNRPHEIPLSFDEPFASVSFAPYRWGESPISRDYPTPEEIDADLASLKGVTRGIRTYTASEGMDVVPAMAAKYGLEVIHSAWLGPKLDRDEADIEALIQSANAHPDTIKRVIVGNEVLLRKDLPVDKLISYIRRVKAAVKQPVSYADVWAFWLQYPQVAQEVDFITIHILPYWEDEPVGVEDAQKHLVSTYRLIQKAFPGKPILIGESGWPTRGRQRGPARAGMEDAAAYVRGLAQTAKEYGFDYNLVEAFDQPWKAQLEGSIGANWGVVDSQRKVKYGMSGPVEQNPGWPYQSGAAALLGALAVVGLLRRSSGGAGREWGLIVLGQILASLAVWQSANAWWLSYDWLDLGWAAIRVGLHAGFAAAILAVAAELLCGVVAPSWAWRWGERLLVIYAGAAVVDTAILVVAGRYRDIPTVEFLVPVLGIAVFGLVRRLAGTSSWVNSFAAGCLFSRHMDSGGFLLAWTMTRYLWAAVVFAPLSEAIALARGHDFLTSHPHFTDQWPLLLNSLWVNGEMVTWSVMLAGLSLPFLAESIRLQRAERRLAISNAA